MNLRRSSEKVGFDVCWGLLSLQFLTTAGYSRCHSFARLLFARSGSSRNRKREPRCRWGWAPQLFRYNTKLRRRDGRTDRQTNIRRQHYTALASPCRNHHSCDAFISWRLIQPTCTTTISETRSRSADIDAIVSLRHQITLRPHTAQRAIWVVSELPQHEPLQRPTSNRVRALQARAIIRLNDTRGPYTLPVFTARRRGCSIYTTRERGSYVRVRCLHYGKHCTQTGVVRTGINSTWVRHTIYRTSQSSFRSTKWDYNAVLVDVSCKQYARPFAWCRHSQRLATPPRKSPFLLTATGHILSVAYARRNACVMLRQTRSMPTPCTLSVRGGFVRVYEGAWRGQM